MTSVLELPTGKLQESCIWMVDCRSAAIAGGATGVVDIAKVVQHILLWISKVMHWNAVIMLAHTDSTTNIKQMLGMLMQLMILSFKRELTHFSTSWWTQRSAFHIDCTSCTSGVSKVYCT